MTWVKVCGLRTAEDVTVAEYAGADAIGFNNVPSSSRFIPLETALDLAEGATVQTFLLTLDATPTQILDILSETNISGVQPYGRHRDEVAWAAVDAGHAVLYAVAAEAGLETAAVPGIPLVDTPVAGKLGGTGKAFDWDLARGIDRDFVLAGGLGPHNVAEAITRLRPWGVDASSGLERSPGRKDHGMVAAFIKKAKET